MGLSTGVAGVVLSVSGCGPEPTTAVLLKLEIRTIDRPFFANIEWFGPSGRINLRDPRIPAIGNFPLKGNALGSVYVELGDTEPPGPRRALVKGNIDADVYWGTARITLVKDQVVEHTLVLTKGPIPDADGDTVPDDIDDCSNEDDRVKCP
jgi:hypothetical protein